MSSDNTTKPPCRFHSYIFNLIETMREKREWSVKQLAREAGVPSNHYYAVRSGKVSPSLAYIDKILNALDFKYGK